MIVETLKLAVVLKLLFATIIFASFDAWLLLPYC